MTGARDIAATKAELRRECFTRRREAHGDGARRAAAATLRLLDEIGPAGGRAVSGYRPIRTEIDPTAAMAALVAAGADVSVPVIEGAGLPLRFRRWTPDAPMVEGAFGAMVPAEGDWLVPRVLVTPLLAFDRAGGRLGYGGGFYDRTLAELRAAGPVLAVGLAYAAQEVAAVPREATDQLLDLIVTEDGAIRPGGAGGLGTIRPGGGAEAG